MYDALYTKFVTTPTTATTTMMTATTATAAAASSTTTFICPDLDVMFVMHIHGVAP